jgi:hypothetical protein
MPSVHHVPPQALTHNSSQSRTTTQDRAYSRASLCMQEMDWTRSKARVRGSPVWGVPAGTDTCAGPAGEAGQTWVVLSRAVLDAGLGGTSPPVASSLGSTLGDPVPEDTERRDMALTTYQWISANITGACTRTASDVSL